MNHETTYVEPQKLRELMQSGEKVVIVDVRPAEEFAVGHVAGAINIPADQLAAQSSEFTKDATIVTVCNLGGSRSCNAAEQLRAMGYENATPLRGGVRSWLEGSESSGNATGK